MLDATSPLSTLRLAITPGVTSPHLSDLLALQRSEEPDVTLAFYEVTGNDLATGLHEGRYDVGMTLQGSSDPDLKTQVLWIDNMAVAMPLDFPLLSHAKLSIAELLSYPVYRWQVEVCPLLDQRLSDHIPPGDRSIQYVTSFEMMALWVAAGYGAGVSAQSRIEHAQAWGIAMRPLSDALYEIVTYLHRPNEPANPAAERFERRAMQIARGGAA
ncbi:substrate-binding domain-containing protein [Pseudomonas aeruginosa]